jgi:2-methylaconitate cis-trans-isomerase PrpF
MRKRYRAAFIRGGTSKAIVFHRRDLPQDRAAWDPIFLSAMGSPDPHGRQLDGMGGGVSSLSKVCVVGPRSRDDADVDYTFAQVQVKEARVDYSINCGNMSSAIGPFAVDEGLLRFPDGDAIVRIHNTNTGKIINATFAVRGGAAVVDGDLEIPGVAGRGAPVRLDFVEPGGATTGKLLPTGHVVDRLEVAGVGAVEVSMVDAANACVFVPAQALGLSGTELPERIERDGALLERLAAIRCAASVAMGIAGDDDAARANRAVPFIGFVSVPQDAITLSGERTSASSVDVTLRMLSNGQPHRALPLTASLCAAVAARIEGTLVNRVTRGGSAGALRVGMPSGILALDARVRSENGRWIAEHGSFYRTTRRLFDGHVYC